MRGFSLIELVVAITIASIASSTAYVAFSRYESHARERAYASVVENAVRRLDARIASKEIAAYRLRFLSGAIGFVTETGFFRKNDVLELSVPDWKTGSGTIAAPASLSWAGISRYEREKFDETFPIDASGSTFSFSGGTSVRGFVGTESLNAFEFTRFDPDDVPYDRVPVILENSGGIVLENVLGKKRLTDTSGNGFPTDTASFSLESGEFSIPVTLKIHD